MLVKITGGAAEKATKNLFLNLEKHIESISSIILCRQIAEVHVKEVEIKSLNACKNHRGGCRTSHQESLVELGKAYRVDLFYYFMQTNCRSARKRS